MRSMPKSRYYQLPTDELVITRTWLYFRLISLKIKIGWYNISKHIFVTFSAYSCTSYSNKI